MSAAQPRQEGALCLLQSFPSILNDASALASPQTSRLCSRSARAVRVGMGWRCAGWAKREKFLWWRPSMSKMVAAVKSLAASGAAGRKGTQRKEPMKKAMAVGAAFWHTPSSPCDGAACPARRLLEYDLNTKMKTLLILMTAAATLCLSACDTIGARSRSNNTGPGGVAGPSYEWYTPEKGTGRPPGPR